MSDPVEPPPLARARLRVGVGAALLLVAAGLAVAVFVTAITPSGAEALLEAPSELDSAAPVEAGASSRLYVHVLGAVRDPGLYLMRDGDRVVDAIAAAGGFGARADRDVVNLARFLSDGEQLAVPRRGSGGGGAPGTQVPGLINLNTATQAELETLPQIGPALAQRIIAWRDQNGRFTTVDDLMSVSGIGEKTFAGLAELVTV